MATPFQPLPCGSGDTGDQECCPEPEVLCDVQPDNSVVQFIRTYTGTPGGGPGALVTSDNLLDGTPYAPTGTVGSCDPYATCTPSSDQDLNAQCAAGESPNQAIVADDEAHPLANAVYVDDASADGLCGGQWDRPQSPLVAPFPVNESFRNTTFDQPGPVLQGTAPYPDLTADVDGAGAGWLQVSDINSGTNGLWQVPSPFPTAQGMNAAITWASHDGTTPGGDGMAFVFTDGSVPAQSIPVGGFGNLGLQNWQGGYVAVVLDEYGQTCTCSHAAQGTIDANPGPCGFCTNTISIQLAGAARQTATCACCTVASLPLAPKALNQTTRSSPARLLVSIIEEGGQTYVSASVDWNDGNGVVQYFDRVNVTACAGPPPATLRMAAYGGSGGAFRAVKEMRDATARPAGVSNWRSFPFTTDTIPACTTLVNVRACVDVTFNNDTQTAGNSDPEAYLLLVDTQTNTILDRDVQSSIPSQVGNPNQLCVEEAVAPAKVPFLRVYVGAESRDQNGEYDQLWENLEITATGTGCPAQPRRTLEVSARCPLPVAIVSGGSDGGGGGTTVVNTPSTFEDAHVCMTVGGERVNGFRREVRAPDGTNTVTFLGVDGLPVTPDGWTAGACECTGTVLDDVCVTSSDFPGVTLPATAVRACDGTMSYLNAATGEPWPGTITVVVCPPDNQTWEEILCDAGNGGQRFRRVYNLTSLGSVTLYDEDLDANPYAVVGPVEICGGTDADREVVCWTQTSTGDQIHTGTIRHGDTLPAPGWILFDQHQTLVLPTEPGLTFVPCGGCVPIVLGDVCVTSSDFPGVILPAAAVQACDGTVTYINANTGDPWPNTTGVVVCPPDPQAWEEIFCDAGNNDQRFRRVYNLTALGSVVFYDEDLDANPYVVVGPLGDCPQSVNVQDIRDSETLLLCDADDVQFLRTFVRDGNGTITATVDQALDGTLYAPALPVGECADCCPVVVGEGCWETTSPAATGRHTALRLPDGTILLVDQADGHTVAPADVIACTGTTVAAHMFNVVPGAPWTPAAVPAGTLTGLSLSVVLGTADVVDADGTPVSDLPVGYSAQWDAPADGTLTPPQSITADAASRAVVVMLVRP